MMRKGGLHSRRVASKGGAAARDVRERVLRQRDVALSPCPCLLALSPPLQKPVGRTSPVSPRVRREPAARPMRQEPRTVMNPVAALAARDSDTNERRDWPRRRSQARARNRRSGGAGARARRGARTAGGGRRSDPRSLWWQKERVLPVSIVQLERSARIGERRCSFRAISIYNVARSEERRGGVGLRVVAAILRPSVRPSARARARARTRLLATTTAQTLRPPPAPPPRPQYSPLTRAARMPPTRPGSRCRPPARPARRTPRAAGCRRAATR